MRELQLASGISRFFALLIDLALFSILYLSASVLLAIFIYSHEAIPQNHIYLPISYFVLEFVYFVFFDFYFGGSIGKRILGLLVVDEKGGRVRLSISAVRVLFFYISGALIVDFVFFFLSRKRQCLHDYVTSTFVVRT